MCQSIGSMERVCEGGVETYTPRGHVVGMLDRDQRTAKVPTYQKHSECANFSSSASPSNSSSVDTVEQVCRGKVHNWNSRGRKSRVRDTAQRLKQVLVVSTCLFSIVSIPGSLSAPHNMDNRMNSPEKWIHPLTCSNQTPVDDPEHRRGLLNIIIHQARIGFCHATGFKADYLTATKLDVSPFKDSPRYEFLPDIPTDLENMETKDLKDALIDTYENLQKVAVGLEEVTWGEQDDPTTTENFSEHFSNAETNLKNVLYEMAGVICELGYKDSMKPDVTRSVMPDNLRNLRNVTARIPRDWVIYRELMNNLDYTIRMFTQLRKLESGDLSPSSSSIDECY